MDQGAGHEARVAKLINLRRWAVVGVSRNPEKYGHRVFLALREAGYRVMGVNPHNGKVAGERIYPSLEALPERPDVVNTFVPPAVTEQVVAECARLGIKHIWMQPGSESEAAIRKAEALGLTVVAHDCAMQRRRRWSPVS